MKNLNTYLIFNGNCRQAMEFYQDCLGGALYMMSYAQAPGVQQLPEEYKDWLIHARLTIKDLVLMASDTQPGVPVVAGNNFFVSVNCESIEEAETFFNAFKEKSTIQMPLQETFWATRFAMLTDPFGVKWMINLDNAKETK